MIPVVELTVDEIEIQLGILLPIIIEFIEDASIDRRNTTIGKNGDLFLGLLLFTGFRIDRLFLDLLFYKAIAKLFVDLISVAITDILTIFLESLIKELIGSRQRCITLGEDFMAIENRSDAKSTNTNGRSIELDDLPRRDTNKDLLIRIRQFTGIGAAVFQLTADGIFDVLLHGFMAVHYLGNLKGCLAGHNRGRNAERDTSARKNLRRILLNEELRPIKNRLCCVRNRLSREFHCAFTLS